MTSADVDHDRWSGVDQLVEDRPPAPSRARLPEREGERPRPSNARAPWRHPAIAAAALLGLYFVTSLFMDPRAHLLTDVGGKTASLEAMVERGDWDPDIGYWFSDADPEGRLFPLDKTRLTPDGQFVNTTSLTMIYAARPLWALGGPRAALLVPMLGAVVAALAAGALERRLKAGSDGAWSMWLVGLASPAFVYALDIWEHSLGLGATAVAVVAVIDVISHDRIAPAVVAGLGYGLAATMRQEALVYGFVAGLVLVWCLWRRRGVMSALTRGAAMAVAAVGMLAVHTMLEVMATGGSFRAGRTAGTVGSSPSLADQLESAAATTIFPFNGDDPLSYVVGGFLLASLVWLVAAHLAPEGSRLARSAAMASRQTAVLWSTYFFMLLWLGPRFVPGLVATTPLAVAGVVAAIHDRRWLPLALGFGPLPLVLATAYSEGAIVQWAGRYQLLTGLVMIVVAVVVLQERRRELFWALAAVGLLMTSFGVVWGIERTNRVAANWDLIEEAAEPGEVLVWRDTVKAREAGAFAYDQPWLGAPFRAEQELASVLMGDAGIEQFIWLDEIEGDLEAFDGFRPGEELGQLDVFNLRLTRYVRAE